MTTELWQENQGCLVISNCARILTNLNLNKGHRIENPLRCYLSNCAQIVPVKVKCLQTIPNETKNRIKYPILSTIYNYSKTY